MVKKKSKGNEIDNELDFDDLDDLNTNMDFGELEDIDDSRNPSKAGIAKELASEAGKGFLDGLIKQTTKKSLPEEYSNNYYELMDYADFAKETFDVNKNKIEKSLYKFGKEVKKVLPFQFKLLDNYLEKYETDYEEFKTQSEEEMREGSIQSNLTGIFDKQLEIQKAIEAKHEASDKVEAKERIANNKINIDILTNIDSNISSLSAFTLQISKEYYRKSLELQFKSYFVQADMLKTMREHYKAFSLQFDNIVKNTGLPEFVKLNNTERVSEIVRTQLVQNTYKNLFSNSEYIQKVKGRVGKLVSDKVSSVTDVVDNVSDQLNMINSAGEGSGGSLGILGNIASGILGTTLGEKLADKISPKIKDRIKDNKTINTGANYLSLLANSPSTLFGIMKDKVLTKQSEYTDEGSPLRYLKSKMFGGLGEILDVTDPGKEEYKVTSSSVLNHNKPAIFDNKVHRSITEIIPMYLAKILKENTDLRQMYSHVNSTKLKDKTITNDELVYDYEGRKLVTGKELVSSVEKNILASKSSKNKLSNVTNNILSGSINELSKDKNKNKVDIKELKTEKSQKLLNDYLDKASRDDSIKFDYKTLIENYDKNAKLNDIVKKDDKLRDLLLTIKKASATTDKTKLDERISDVKRKYPLTAVKELFSGTSKLAGSKILNKLTDDIADTIAKAFSMFITNTGKDISIENITTGECFKYIPNEEFKVPVIPNGTETSTKKNKGIRQRLVVFINEVRTIKNVGDILKESSLAVLIGAVNRSLKDNFELDPSVFQTLYEYSPVLGKKGKLGVDNLIERKLFQEKDKEYISIKDLRDAVKVPKQEIQEARAESVKSELSESISKLKDKMKQDLANAGSNPFEITRVFVRNVKESGKLIRDESKKAFDIASKKMDKLKDTLNNLTEETVSKALDSLIIQYDEAGLSIDEMIKKEKEARDEELKSLSEAKNKLTELMNDPSALKDIERSITRTTKLYDSSVKAMEKLKSTMSSQKDALIRLKNSSSDNKLELIKKIRTEIENTLSKVKEILKSSEEATA